MCGDGLHSLHCTPCSSSTSQGWDLHNLGVFNADISLGIGRSLHFHLLPLSTFSVFVYIHLQCPPYYWVITLYKYTYYTALILYITCLEYRHSWYAVMENSPTSTTPPYFSIMGCDSSSSNDLSTGYLEDALVEYGDRSKRKRSLLCDTHEDRAFQVKRIQTWVSLPLMKGET